MACLHISRSPGFSPPLSLRASPTRRRFYLRCRLPESTGGEEEAPESLFMKELRRRGMTPTSIVEESGKGLYGLEEKLEEEMGSKGGDGGSEERRGRRKRNGVVSAEYEKELSNQRERSMALNSEGLEGLIPRAKLLLTLGGTFFVAFWPLILITVSCFAALYFYFGPSFVHDASNVRVSPPPYIDPYTLLEDEKISQVSPYVK